MNVGAYVRWFNTATQLDDEGEVRSVDHSGNPEIGNVCGVASVTGDVWWVQEAILDGRRPPQKPAARYA